MGYDEAMNTILKNKNLSPKEISKIISNLEKTGKVKWRFLGDREANCSTIDITEKNESALLERVTNSIDAYIEKFSNKYNEIEKLQGPYNVIKFLKEKEKSIPNDDIFVEVHTGKDSTNFLFWDNGIGLTNEEMPNTILSLNQINKFRKSYVTGSYGQGGSTACANNDYTVIFSVKKEEISFTIIRYNDLTYDKDAKSGCYDYLVLEENNLPIKVPFEKVKQNFKAQVKKEREKFFCGTTVFHVGFKKKIEGRNFYTLCDEILFNPAFKYTIGYETNPGENDSVWTSRTMGGLKNRLLKNEKEGEVRINKTKSQYFNDDVVIITSYYLKNQEASSYLAEKTRPVLVTLNGQVHGKFDRRLIEKAKLPDLKTNLIVEINCNNISNPSKRHTFLSNRQTLKDDAKKKIQEEVVKFLEQDEYLKDQNEERYRQKTKKGLEKSSEKMDKILANMLKKNELFGNIKVKGPEGKGFAGTTTASGKGSSKPKIISTLEFPTYVKITNKHPIRAVKGQTLVLNIESNLSDETAKYYNLSVGEEVFEYITKDSVQIDRFRGGRSKIKMNLQSSIEVGANFFVYINLHSHKNPLQSDERLVLVVKKEEKDKGGSAGGSPKIIPVIKEENEELYNEKFHSDESNLKSKEKFAKYEKSESRIVVYINLSNEHYQSFLINNKKIKNLEKVKTMYTLFLAYACIDLENSEDIQQLFDGLEVVDVEQIKNNCLSISASTILQILTFDESI